MKNILLNLQNRELNGNIEWLYYKFNKNDWRNGNKILLKRYSVKKCIFCNNILNYYIIKLNDWECLQSPYYYFFEFICPKCIPNCYNLNRI